MVLPSRLKPFLWYGLSVAFGKGLTLITLPVLARGLPPSEFVRLDIAASIIEPIGLLAAFALADSLFRFGQGDEVSRRVALSRLLGLAILASLLLIGVTQFVLVPMLLTLPNLPGEGPFRAVLVAACLGGLIELPLAWWRLQGRAGGFLIFIAARAMAQAILLIGLIHSGFGVDAILLSNAAIDLALVLALIISLPAGTRPTFNFRDSRPTLRYTLPLLGSALAMFALGACDRWFLAGHETPARLAHYALAAKLAMALALVSQPFGLWWYPRRLGVLAGPDGRAQTIRFWLLGISLMGAGALVVMLAARILILGFLPVPYHGALGLMPPLLAIIMLHELVSLSNGTLYARAAGYGVLSVNAWGAALAIGLYWLLIPAHGLNGAVIATLAGHGLRLLLCLGAQHEGERLPYPVGTAFAFLTLCLGGVWLLSRPELPDLSLIPAGILLIAVAAIQLGRAMPRDVPA